MLQEVRRPPLLPSPTPTPTPTHAHTHTKLLDELLDSARWQHLAGHLDASARAALPLAWHRLPGWADARAGLHAIKQHAVVATLSNGSTRALADMVRPPLPLPSHRSAA